MPMVLLREVTPKKICTLFLSKHRGVHPTNTLIICSRSKHSGPTSHLVLANYSFTVDWVWSYPH